MTALLTDEYIDLETFPTRISVDQRITAPGNGTLRGNYLDLSQARVSAERAAGLYQEFDPTNVLRAEMLNLAGYSYLVFARTIARAFRSTLSRRTARSHTGSR